MVVTRRARSIASASNNDGDGDAGTFVSARASARPMQAPAAAPPPPRLPPPPPPLPPPVDQQIDTAGGPTAAEMMPLIPEEVEVNNNDNSSGLGSGGGNIGGHNNDIVETANNMPGGNNIGGYNNNNNNIMETNNNMPHIPPQPQPQVPPPLQYLQIRVSPPSQSRPSRIHRRHRPPPPPPDNGPNNNNMRNRSRIKEESQNSAQEVGEIVRVLIPPNGFSSERQLAECLNQAQGAVTVQEEPQSRWNDHFGDDYSMDEYFDDGRDTVNVAGMFREKDRVFIPLSVIYSNPTSFVDHVLCLKLPPLPKQTLHHPQSSGKRRSIFITFLELIGIAIVGVASWWMYGAAQLVDWDYVIDEVVYRTERCFFAIMNFPFWLFDRIIEFPLREIYRHGPSIIGWEGEPLPRICARITYHGDEAFWSRNLEECEQLYYAKESAAMQVRKPIVIGFFILALFYMVKSIVAARALRRRERIDPNMVETYRAIQMLTRQLRRAVYADNRR